MAKCLPLEFGLSDSENDSEWELELPPKKSKISSESDDVSGSAILPSVEFFMSNTAT